MESTKPFDETLKEAWPWAKAFSRYLKRTRSAPFRGSHLMFGSDYSGDHPKSEFRMSQMKMVRPSGLRDATKSGRNTLGMAGACLSRT